MTATADPPAPPVEAAPAAVLDRAEGVELLGDLHGSGYKEGAALVRRADGQIVQLGPLMYALLESVDGRRTRSELAELLSERLGRGCDEEHVAGLAEKLAAQGLLAGTEHQAPPRRNPLLALHWKVLVTNPVVTRRLTAPFTILFRPWLMWPLLACFVAVCWFVLFEKGVAAATSDAFRSPELLLLVFVLAVASAGLHELGHAAACRYGGATPAGMGMGLYMVWPAFYTDVTDSYRLPRRDRLRVDLGGIYFNAVICVVTLGVWLAWRIDALLLLIALQLLMIVKNLSPAIRSDGYHVLADATGVPDLYAHMLPTLRRLIPGRQREPSALTGRARLLVTAWVLIIVPVLLSMLLAAVILLPRLMTTAWDSGRAIAETMPDDGAAGVLASCVRLLALSLPVLGSALITQKIVRTLVAKGRAWSVGRPVRRAVLVGAAAAACAGAAFAWWPSGQYQAVRPDQGGTLTDFGTLVSAPVAAARPRPAAATPVHLTPGTHLAVSMIPVGGATKRHPALFVIPGSDGDPAVAIVTDSAADPGAPGTATQTTAATTGTTATTPTSPPPAPGSTAASTPTQPVRAAAFPFTLPKAPGPGGTQAVAVGTKDGGVTYNVGYSLVTVRDGAPVTNTNSAYAFASCKACTTVAVSFQVVLIVGQSDMIAPINAAGALNVDCPACVTTAIADQIVVTLKAQPSQELLAKLQSALKELNALPALGANGTPAAVAAAVTTVQQQIDTALHDSGLLANPTTSTATTTTPAATTTTPTTTTSATTRSTTTTGATTATTPAATTQTSMSTTTTTPTATTTTGTTTTTPAGTTTTSSG
jgi:putative peptide zinc metalloprotease protein